MKAIEALIQTMSTRRGAVRLLRLWALGPTLPLLFLVWFVDVVLALRNECLFSFIDAVFVTYTSLNLVIARVGTISLSKKSLAPGSGKSRPRERYLWCVGATLRFLDEAQLTTSLFLA